MYFPTQISFLIWGEHIAGRESKYTNFLSEQNSLSPEGNKNLNFRLSRDKVVHCETAANVSASLRKQNNFLVIFELGGMTKHFWKLKSKWLAPRETVRIALPWPAVETKLIVSFGIS